MILLALTAICVWLLLPNNKGKRAAEHVREDLRRQGFKTDISESDLSKAAGLGTNNDLLMLAEQATRNMLSFRRLDLMKPVSSNSAMVAWTEENPLATTINDNSWAELQEMVAERKSLLDKACEAVIAAPFRFKTALPMSGDPIPDSLRVRVLSPAVATRTILALHEQNHLDAWTNLLALTRLVTAWQTEPIAMSHTIRFRWVATAHRITWEALQANDWTEAELVVLQHEWESPNFFDGLPETAALALAGTVAYCNFARQQPPPPGPTLREFASDLVNSPNRALFGATSGWRNARYRNIESYDDETAWLLYFRDCELDYRKAVTANSWAEIRDLPGATNCRPSDWSKALPYSVGFGRIGPGGGWGWVSGWAGVREQEGQTLLERAAQAEATRRLIMTALAVKRFHFANHHYPESLAMLVPGFLKSVPKDFMDGKPLRYTRTGDDRFILYSVGLDCVDDHGQMLAEKAAPPAGPGFGRREWPDLVWPLPALPTEVRAYAQTANRSQTATSEGRPNWRYKIEPATGRTNRFEIKTVH